MALHAVEALSPASSRFSYKYSRLVPRKALHAALCRHILAGAVQASQADQDYLGELID